MRILNVIQSRCSKYLTKLNLNSIWKKVIFFSIFTCFLGITVFCFLFMPASRNILYLQENQVNYPNTLEQLNNHIKTVASLSKDEQKVNAISDYESQEILSLLTQKGIKPDKFEIFISNQTSTISVEWNQVLFSSIFDALNDLQKHWHLTTAELDAQALSNPGEVHLLVKLKTTPPDK